MSLGAGEISNRSVMTPRSLRSGKAVSQDHQPLDWFHWPARMFYRLKRNAQDTGALVKFLDEEEPECW